MRWKEVRLGGVDPGMAASGFLRCLPQPSSAGRASMRFALGARKLPASRLRRRKSQSYFKIRFVQAFSFARLGGNSRGHPYGIDWLRRSFSVLALSEPGCRLDMVLGLTGTLAAPRLGASKLGPAPGYRYGLPAFRCPKPAEGSGRQGAWGRNAVFS